jgi:peptidyl-prolyl cis-trans isomerase C
MKFLREPLLHFSLLGVLIFAVNAWREGREGRRPVENAAPRIEITAGTVAWLREGYERQWHRAADADELRGLVNDHLREEVLYREALAIGLDRDDTIVRRRMAQKMEFLTQDIATAAEPDDAALRKFFEENAARYAKAARVSFRHIYFSKERRGAWLETDASEALAALAKGAEEETLGDPFLRETEFTNANAADLTAALGGGFAGRVMALPAGEWRGPVASGYGVHLVWVSERVEPQPVAFETAREAVTRDWAEERRLATNRDFLQRLKERYQITVDEAAIAGAPARATKTAQR